MGYLQGLQQYLDESYEVSIFDQALSSKDMLEIHMHRHIIIKAKVLENFKYDIKIETQGNGNEVIPKVSIKMLYPLSQQEAATGLIKTDNKVRGLDLEPILAPGKRYHIKNKSLFPLMKEKTVVFFTLLEGEIIRGIIAGFSRYEITVNMKGGVPVTLMRHSILYLRDKKCRSFMKSFQAIHRDWEKSGLFVE
jgi:sRNA-binding regulator protein Hfq